MLLHAELLNTLTKCFTVELSLRIVPQQPHLRVVRVGAALAEEDAPAAQPLGRPCDQRLGERSDACVACGERVLLGARHGGERAQQRKRLATMH